jgi:cellulose synthase operon protein C
MKSSWVVLFALSLSLPAVAQPKKAGKAAAPKAAPPKGAEAKKAPAAADAKKAPERAGPAKFDAKEQPKLDDMERDALVDKKRDESIESLKKIIPKIEDGNPQKADMLFQLSENYWEKSRFLNRKEMVKYFGEQKTAEEKKNKGEKIAEPKEDHRESELYRAETMRLYETILRDYPTYDRKDEVLFNLAYNLYDIGKKDQAVKRYEELLKSYPGSKFVCDGYVQLGNHYFDVANVLEKAKGYYEKGYACTNPRIKSYALYKLAWCDFNGGEHEKALKKLQDTIDFAEKQTAGKSETGGPYRDLKNEAMQDSIRMFVELNRADDAIAYFKAHAGKKKATTLTSRLADGLANAGHHENAIKSYRYLLTDNPVSESAPDFQQSIIKSYEGLRQRDNVKAEVKKLAELYRPGSSWWKANESKKDVLRNGFNVAEEAMRSTVTEYHQEAQKTKQVDTYRLARDIYKQYVEAFASNDDEQFVSDQAFNLKFYYAEILWALEEWEAAAGQYDGVVAFKVPNRDDAKQIAQEKYRQTAAYNSILAYDKLVKIERGQLQKTSLKDADKVEETKKKGGVDKQEKVKKRDVKELAEKPLTKFETALIAACDKYNTTFPKNPDEIEVSYQAAVIFYDKNKFIDAARRFTDIITRFPEDKRSAEAADLSMGVLEEKEEWLELNKSARAFKANTKLTAKNREFSDRVSKVVEGSQYKYVDEVVYKKEKDPKKAAGLFLDFAKEFPTSENADRALTYAMIISREANELDRAIEIGERVLKEYKNTVFDLKVKNSLAFFYEKMARFEKSAEMYENFIATYDLAAAEKAVGYENVKALLKAEKEAREKEAKASKGKPGAIAPAAIATVELKSIKDDAKKKEREALVKEADGWVSDAQFNAGFWYEGVGKFDKALAAYNRYVTRFKDSKDAPEIAFNVALLLEKDGKLLEANKQYDSFASAYAKDARVGDARRLDSKYRQFLNHLKLKNSADADKLAKEIIASFPKLKDEEKKQDRAMLALGHAKFYQLEPQWQAYLNQKFDYKNFGPALIRQFAKTDRPRKEKSLAELEKAYTDVLAAGNPEFGIAALTRVGLGYADFAGNIAALPDPVGFDQDQTDLFRGELENRYVFPVEEKAVEALEKAVAKSSELKLYNEWTLAAQDKLNKYKPNLYGKVREVPYRGSEFFATSGFLKDAELPVLDASVEKAAPAPAPAEKKEAANPSTPSAAAPTPGAGT